MMLFRPQRGGLAEAMREVQSFDGTTAGLQRLIKDRIIGVQPYAVDERVGWDTHIVMTVHGVAGFTNGPVRHE